MSSSSVDKNERHTSSFDKAKCGATIFLIAAIIIAVQPYTYVEEKWLGWSSETHVYSLAPTLLSTLFSGLYIMVLNIRVRSEVIFCNRDESVIYYITEWILLILTIFVTAMVWSVFITVQDEIIFGMTGMHLLLAAVVFSFIGIRSLAGFVWILLICIGIDRAVNIDKAMGLAGAIFIVCSLIGLTLEVIRLYSGKIGEMLYSDFMGAKVVISGDVGEAKKTTENFVKGVGNLVGSVNRDGKKD